MKPTPYQTMVLSVPERWNVLCAGGRGGGKTSAMLLAVLRHVEKYGDRARPLIVRESYKALAQVEEELHALLTRAYGRGVTFNRNEHVFRVGNGAVIECGQIDGPKAFTKFQGRETTLLVVEEYCSFGDRRWVEMLKSNLRGPEGVPLRVIATANPGGPLHAYIRQTYITAAPAWHPFEVDGETWVHAPSTFVDNPHLDGADYERRLRASVGHDEALARAWIEGDWNIDRGAYFGPDLDDRIHMLTDAQVRPASEWPNKFIAMDWGSAAPAVVYACARSPEAPGFPRGSLVLLDELATADPNDLNVGLRWPPSKLAEATKRMASRWNVHPSGIGDDAAGLDESLHEELARHGIYLQRPQKDRVAGWQLVRQMLANATAREGPGLWISEHCKYLWATLPYLQRDPRYPEDIETSGPDHGADALRYAVMHAKGAVVRFSSGLIGLY